MFFNIELRQRNMSPDDLMSVRPEVLAKLILHKRERLVEKLPKLIAELGEQKQISENLARRSRANKEDLDVKVLNLKMERKTVLQELTKMFDKKHDKELISNVTYIKKIARDLDIITIDTYPYLKKELKQIDKRKIWFVEGHHTSFGNDLVCDLISSNIK